MTLRAAPLPTLLAAVLWVSSALAAPASAAVLPAAPDGVWPLDPQPAVVGAFDPPADPWGRGHRGVDLAGRVGQPVRAALAGTVSVAAAIAGRGVLVVDHGPTRTTYEPVAALVPVGTVVERGEVVGRLEAVGSHCSPAACLHWGWRSGDLYLDPLDLVGGGPVRLLPWAGTAPEPGWARPLRSPAGPAVPVGRLVVPGVAMLSELAEMGLLPCPRQARGWACR